MMIQYYLMAIEKGHIFSLIKLGYHNEHIEKNYDIMKKCYSLYHSIINKDFITNKYFSHKNNNYVCINNQIKLYS
jgi:midasin (ATPase involved in ribosome maturation)